MMSTFQDVCTTLCLLLCLAANVTSSDVVFTSSPATIRPLVTDELRLRCSLVDGAASVVIGKRQISDVSSESAPSDVSYVHSIMITKSGVDVAAVSVQLAAEVFDNTTGVSVSGQVTGRGGDKGYLEISWKYPGAGQSGSYQCVISGITQHGHIQTFTKSLDVSESEVSLNDVVKYIHQLQVTNDLQTATIAGLTATNAALNATMNANMAGINATISGMNTNISSMDATISGMNTNIASMDATIADHTTKLDTHVLFTAFRTSAVTVSVNNVVVFNDLKINLGGGYDTSTGIFTCPVEGYYSFDFHVQGQNDQQAHVSLYHNGNSVTSAWADGGFDFQSASNSVNLQLKVGDTVKLVSSAETAYIYGGGSYRYTSFSGTLIAMA